MIVCLSLQEKGKFCYCKHLPLLYWEKWLVLFHNVHQEMSIDSHCRVQVLIIGLGDNQG